VCRGEEEREGVESERRGENYGFRGGGKPVGERGGRRLEF